ncbi:hypothetical protein [Umboniibacter marinipuniceus]|uniref:hypothetical protein n=1 Tax=Umboniibacter marinipuniceus TaxID=569599 RepID=UPI001474F920|nr:hypothetical protein [Umboniibacter marinipuniceus]
MIKNTAEQDLIIEAKKWHQRAGVRWGVIGLLAVIVLNGFVWSNDAAEQSVDRDQLLIATVSQGLFERDIAATGRMIASDAPTLFATEEGQIELLVDAARSYFAQGKRIEGALVEDVLNSAPTAFADADKTMTKGLFSVTAEEDGERISQSWHIDKAVVRIHTEETTMLSFKHMSEELNRQEVSVWKKVIRVISHEINNSLGPIMSMVHSGKMITQTSNDSRLTRVFTTLGDRADHLNQFVLGYAKFARLPSPRKPIISGSPFCSDYRLCSTSIWSVRTRA